jgi:hypothetical protein
MDMEKNGDKTQPGNVVNLILFQKFEDFVDYFEPIVERFPRYEMYALSTSIKNCMLEILRLIIVTNKTRNKLPGWHEIDTRLEVLRFYVRRSRKKGSKFLSIKSYETAVKKLSEIGKILGGIIRKGG